MRSLYILVLGLFLSIQSFATIPQLLVKSPSANSTVPLYFGNPPASSFPFQGRKDAYLAFTFNIPVVVKSTFEGGAIAIKNYDTDAHIAWGNLDKAIISGNTVYVPLSYGSNIETTLPVGQMFYVTVSANTFADASNPTHLYPGSASENFWRMTRRTNDGNGPTPVSYSPALGQQDAPITREFSITFDEPVLYNYNQHSTGAGVAVAPSGSPGYRADVTITMSADYRTINFKGDPGLFLSKGTDYYFTILEGKVFDVDGNYFSITNPATWTFKTFDAFNPTNFSPAKNTSNLPQDQVFTVTMNNDLDISTWIPHDPSTGLGTGIALRRAYDDYLQEYVFVSSDQVEVNGNILSVRFTQAQPLTTYYISTGPNVIRDAYGQFYHPGTTWRFSTGAATNNAPINITLSASSITENNAVNAVIGTLSSTDPDAGNTFTYSLVAGTGSTNNGSFNINGSQLRASQVFDYETKGTYSIRIRTTDQGGLFFDKMFTITINDATENNSPIDLVPTKTNISENNSVNDLVGNLNTVDPDGSGSFTYALVAGAGSTDNASFNINGNQLRASVVFDYESKSSYNIRLRTTDAGGLSFEKPFTITINNTNETPTDITLSASSINENNSVNAVIATISTTDSDIGNTFTYILAFGEGDDDNASFNLNGSQLRANAAFNYEAKNSYSIRLLTTDNTSRQFSKQFTISIKDVNEAPFNIALSGSSIDENQPANTTIGSLSASDPDLGNTFTYTLVSGAGSEDNASFNINGTQLRSGQTFDFESKSSYAVRIRATDQAGLFFEKQFTVTVNDVSEDTSAPAIISLSPINGGQGVSVPYGSMAVITFDEPVKKASPGFVKLYRKQAGGDVEILNYYYNNPNWTVSGNEVSIGMWAQLGTYGAEYYFLIDPGVIANMSDIPFGGFDNANSIWEFRVLDNREPEPVPGTRVPSSVINLPVNTMLSMEFEQAIKFGSGNIDIRYTDDFGTALESFHVGVDPQVQIDGKTLIISPSTLPFDTQISIYIGPGAILNIDDVSFPGYTQNIDWFYTTVAAPNGAPTDISLTAASINENNAVNTIIGNLSSIDPNPGNIFTYSLVSGSGSADNANFNINGAQLRSSVSFDFETKSSYSVRVRSTDQGGLFFEKSFIISINNINEAPNNITLSANTVAENNAVNTVIGLLIASDPDPGNTFVYTMAPSGVDNASFNISGNQLRASSGFNFETNSTYSISVRVADQGGLFYDKPFTIEVTDVNDSPTNILLSSSSIAENNLINEVVGTFSAADQDIADTFTYELVTGNGSGNNTDFTINGSQLLAATVFNFEVRNSYSIRVRATDQGGLFYEKQFFISISDVEEDLTGPTIVSFSPLDDAIDVPTDANLVVTFDENIVPGNSVVRLRRITNNSQVLDGTPATHPDLFSINDNTLTIHLTQANKANILPGTEYYVQITNAAVSDLSGNAFASGWTNAYTWNFTTAKSDQSILFSEFALYTFGDPLFEIDASSSSNLDLTFNSSNLSVATVSGNTLTIVGAGSTTITASQVGNSQYNAATSVQRTLTVNKANQTITIDPIADKLITDGSFAVNASATSSLTLSYDIQSGPASISGNVITLDGTTGTVVVEVSQAGNTNFNPATSTESFVVTDPAKTDQTITFGALAAKTFGDPTFELTASASSNLVVSYESSNQNVATVSGSTVTIVGAGSATITASQSGDATFNPAPSVQQVLTVNKADQTISIEAIADKLTTDAAFDVVASSTSNLALTYEVAGPATNSGATITLNGTAGTVTVTVSQSGNANNNAASAQTMFEVTEQPAKQDQTITIEAIADKLTTDTPFDVVASTTSGLVLTYEVSGPATINGTTITLAGTTGTVTVTVSQAGDDNFNPASATETFEVIESAKQDQAITFDALAAKTFGDAAFELTATASSGLAVSYSSSDETVATISGSTVTILNAGSTTITASQVGNSVFEPAQSVTQTLVINKAAQTITFEPIESQLVETGILQLTATASSGLAVTFELIEGSASLNENTLTLTGLGLVIVSASQAGDANYLSAEAVEQSFEIITVTDVQINERPTIQVYPNPVTSQVTIEGLSHVKEVRLIDLQGVEVMQAIPDNTNLSWDVSRLKQGVYTILITTDAGVQTQRIIKN